MAYNQYIKSSVEYAKKFSLSCIQEIEQKQAPRKRKGDRQARIDKIVVVMTAYFLREMLENGALATEKTVQAMASMGVNEFSLGSSKFAEGSDDATLARRLLDDLEAALQSTGVLVYIKSGQKPHTIVSELYNGW